MTVNKDNSIATATHDDGQPAKRKRLRIPKSCIPCLKGKRACDRGRPACGRCARSGQGSDCTYDPRLPQTSTDSSKRSNGAYNDSDDDDDDGSAQESKQLAALQKELQEARNETRRLHQLLRNQLPHASSPPSRSSSSQRPWPNASAAASTSSSSRHGAHSTSNDLHAARGLQMLAEIAGPQHQDADSNASNSRILHWSGPGSHAASSSQASPAAHSSSTSLDPTRPAAASPAADKYPQPPTTASVYGGQFSRSGSHNASQSQQHDLDSPKNINGTQMYYGDGTSGDGMLRTVAARTAGSSRSKAGNSTASIHETMARRDVQYAFNSVLDPSRDTFPFATIWSSGTAFIDEVLPFFPRPEDFDSICASFVRHFSAMCPALTIPTAINHAKNFSRMSRKQQAQVSLPWLSVFLMICALGKNCDLESTTVGVDRKVRMLDAFLAGEASQQPSRASSPAPGESTDTKAGAADTATHRLPAMVSDLFLSAAYQSLRLCSFLSAPTIQTIHSQLLIGSYLLNTERAASFWPLLGSVARQAQSIGLHVDPYKIKRDWDPVEADTRRRLWWAVVHQDVILSSIFGRPLGITRFSCRFPGTTGVSESVPTTYATLQCEFSQFARIYLDENQDRSWSQKKIIGFTETVLEWYMNIPPRYRPELGPIDIRIGSSNGEDREAIQNYHAAGVDLNSKGLMEVHQSGNLAVEVFYILLSLHRSNLFPSSSSVDAEVGKDKGEPNETSLHICTQALRRITRAQQTMIDHLGRARATMFWKIAYYSYQAAIAGAYIVFVKPQSKHAESALEDLAILVDFFDRMPERWTGLKMAKHGLRVLRKLAVAARETPGAASMRNGELAGEGEEEVEGGGSVAEVVVAVTPSTYLNHAAGTAQSGMGESGFMSLFGSSFMSPSTASQPILNSNPPLFSASAAPSSSSASSSSTTNAMSHSTPFSDQSFLVDALAANAGSPLTKSLASVPLVTLFNNTYDHKLSQQSTSTAAGKAAFCYDPFLPDPHTNLQSSSETTSTAQPVSSAHPHQQHETSPKPPMNQKDLATYWSEYFSLQLDWDRLTGLA